jgi:adenylate kinase family enzyme
MAGEREREIFLSKPETFVSQSLDKLPPPRFAIIGPECSGKSTLLQHIQNPPPIASFKALFYQAGFSPSIEITANVVVNTLNILMEDEPYKSQGFLLTDVPCNPVFVEVLNENSPNFAVDAAIVLNADHEKLVSRATKKLPKGLSDEERQFMEEQLSQRFFH